MRAGVSVFVKERELRRKVTSEVREGRKATQLKFDCLSLEVLDSVLPIDLLLDC